MSQRASLIKFFYGNSNEQESTRASQIWPFLADIFAIQDAGFVWGKDGIDKKTISQFSLDQELTAADEHAARSLISRHSGHIKGGRLVFNGFDMTESTAKAVKQNPDDERLAWEQKGLQKLVDGIMSDGMPRAIVSPSKIMRQDGSSYGLAMLFFPKKGGENNQNDIIKLDEYIVMYEEQYGSTESSTNIAKKLASTRGDKSYDVRGEKCTVEQLLTNPIVLDGDFTMENIFEIFKIDQNQREFSERFKATLATKLHPELSQLAQLLIENARIHPETVDRRRLGHLLAEADRLKDTIFGYAKVLAKAMKTGDYQDLELLDAHLLRDASGSAQKPINMKHYPPIFANDITSWAQAILLNASYVGSVAQCPSAYFSDGGQAISPFALMEGAHIGALLNMVGPKTENKQNSQWKKMDCVKCPNCNFVSTKARPHLRHSKKGEWICGNPNCVHHNSGIYKKVVTH